MVSRLCAPIEGTDAARLADCLGLDVNKYRSSVTDGSSAADLREEALLASVSSLDNDDLYKVRNLRRLCLEESKSPAHRRYLYEVHCDRPVFASSRDEILS